MKKTTIGILAGMGPRSTSPFLELLLDQCQEQYGAKYDIDYPHILVYSLPTPFFIDRETDEQALKSSIREGLERLENCGVDFIGIPCNSAHSHFDYITEASSIPVLNIIKETVCEIEEGSKVSIFATEMTVKFGLYQDELKAKSCDFVFEEEWQDTINEVILRIKNQEDLKETKQLWDELISKAVERAVDKIVIACTDLNVVLDSNREDVKFIDSSKALAKSLVEMYLDSVRTV